MTTTTTPRRGEHEIISGSKVESCRSCGASIIWIRTRRGKALPLSVATIERRDGRAFALAHFADCPDSKDWSKR